MAVTRRYSISIDELRQAYLQAKESSQSELDAFATLRLNQMPKQVRGAGLISMGQFTKCEGPVNLEDFRDCDAVVLGVDLSASDDISAITAMGRSGDNYIPTP